MCFLNPLNVCFGPFGCQGPTTERIGPPVRVTVRTFEFDVEDRLRSIKPSPGPIAGVGHKEFGLASPNSVQNLGHMGPKLQSAQERIMSRLELSWN
jgi:hypothetical protein